MEISLFYTQFSLLNAGNRLLGLCNFKIFWGSMPPDTPWKRGLSVTLFKSAGLIQFLLKPMAIFEDKARWFFSVFTVAHALRVGRKGTTSSLMVLGENPGNEFGERGLSWYHI